MMVRRRPASHRPRGITPQEAWRRICSLLQQVFYHEKVQLERRFSRERRVCRHLLKRERAGDHVVFALLLILVFFALDTYLTIHWARLPLDAATAAMFERLLFGGRG